MCDGSGTCITGTFHCHFNIRQDHCQRIGIEEARDGSCASSAAVSAHSGLRHGLYNCHVHVVPPGRTTLDDKGVACRAVTLGTGQGGGRGGAAVVVSRALEIQAQRTGADQGAEVSLHWLCWRVRRQWAACIRDHSYAASLTHKRNPCAKLWVRAATLFLWANIGFWCDWSL